MGLFINIEQHHGMYKNVGKINESNQTSFRKDYLTELLKEQQRHNDLLHQSIYKLNLLTKQRDTSQSLQWQEINNRLTGLEKVNDLQGFQIMEQLKVLSNENEKLQMQMENERIFDQEVINQTKQNSLNYEELSQQINEQKESQQEVLTKLDNQEALTEKALRQISHLRSTLFERTSYLAETIEDSYKLTSSYLYELLTGIDQPLTFYMKGQHKKEKESQEK